MQIQLRIQIQIQIRIQTKIQIQIPMNPSIHSDANSNTDPNYNLGSHEATAATYCNTLQQLHHVATRCNTLQHVAIQCNSCNIGTAATHWTHGIITSDRLLSVSFVALIETGETCCNSCNTLPHIATAALHLQHIATAPTHYNTLPHIVSPRAMACLFFSLRRARLPNAPHASRCSPWWHFSKVNSLLYLLNGLKKNSIH